MLLLVVLGILIFDTRYDRYALVMVVLVILVFEYKVYVLRDLSGAHESMLPALNSNVTVQGEKWRYGGIYLSVVEEWPFGHDVHARFQ